MTAESTIRREADQNRVGDVGLKSLVELFLASMPEDPEQFERLCESVDDWEELFAHARREGVAGVIWYHLAQPRIAVAPGVKKQAARYLAVEKMGRIRLRAVLDEAVRTLERAGVRAVALKGPTLGDRIYPEPGLRPCGDIDLLVMPADLERAIAALEEIGYQAETGDLARYYRENHHHLHLSRAHAPLLELHFRATTGFGTMIPAEELVSRAVPYPMASGTTVWVLSPEDEFLYLAVHAARHLFGALYWLYDLKAYLRAYPQIDWNTTAVRARSLGVVAASRLTMDYLQERLSAEVPESGQFKPRHGMLVGLAASMVAITGRQTKGTKREKAGQLLHRALLCDSPMSSVWVLRHRVIRFLRRRMQRRFPKLVPARSE